MKIFYGHDAPVRANHIAQTAAQASGRIYGHEPGRVFSQGAGGTNVQAVAVRALVASGNGTEVFFGEFNLFDLREFGVTAPVGAGL
jgi:hypothetical protein